MQSEFDTALPSIVQVQTLIKQAIIVELKLLTDADWENWLGSASVLSMKTISLQRSGTQIAYLKPNNLT